MSQGGEMSRPTGEVREEPEMTQAGPTRATEQIQDVGSAPPTQNPQQALPQPYPQYQNPYAPYPPQALPYAQPVRVLPPYNKAWTISKLVLTCLSLCWAVVVLSLSLRVSTSNHRRSGGGLSLYALVIQIVAIGWNLAELTTFLVRSHNKSIELRRGIHPGAHVGMHLVFWLACVLGICISLQYLMSAMDCYEVGDEDSGYYNYCGSYAPSRSYLSGLRAVLAVWCLAFVNHFVLFVLACIDTHRRNHLRPANVVFAQPGATAPQPLTYYPPPPQQAHMTPAPVPLQQQGQGQNYQNLAGFYAPPRAAQAPSPAAPAPVPTTQPGPSVPADGDEITPAPARA